MKLRSLLRGTPSPQTSAGSSPAGSAGPLLICEGVDVAYGSVQVLFGVDAVVNRGEIVALLGTNGAGKSTLLKAVAGLLDPLRGTIRFNGRDITHAGPGVAAAMGIVQVPGGKAVFPTLTVAEHFRAAAWLLEGQQARVKAATEEVLDRFPRLRDRWGQMAGNLSGGEQQQLAVGMAFLAEPELLVIDELSLGLAPTIVEQLLEAVRDLNRRGSTVVIVEQSVNVALTIATRAYFMEKGEIRFEGPTADLLERGDILRSVFLEGAASRPSAAPAGAPTTPQQTGRLPAVGPQDGRTPAPTSEAARTPAAAHQDAVGLAGEPILEVHGLGVSFGGIRAVDDVDLDLQPGEILGLIGPNGAGKTTVLDLISGHLAPTSGRIVLSGHDVTQWAPDRRARAGLGRSFQDARIFPSMTVAENLALALDRHLPFHDPVAAALCLPAVREQEVDIAWTVSDLIDLMGLGAFRDKFVAELSTGSRRVVDLAMAIAHDPTVLLLDEPSSGIAQREAEALAPLLHRIRSETGCAMVVIEHDMPLILAASDRMAALELGRVIVSGLPAEVIADPRVVASYLGTDESVIHRSGTAARAGGAARKPAGDIDATGAPTTTPNGRPTRTAKAAANGKTTRTAKPAANGKAPRTAKAAAKTRTATNGTSTNGRSGRAPRGGGG